MDLHSIPEDGAALAAAVATGTTLVDVWAPWCGACKVLGATLDHMAPTLDPRVKILKINMEDCPDTMTGLGVLALPTLLLFREGRLIDRRVGALGRAALQEFIAPHL